jgi:tRNA U54 and U55 pseudouridine synthase Pus10
MTLQDNVKEFHVKYGLPVGLSDDALLVEDEHGTCMIDRRIALLWEETRELISALEELYDAINCSQEDNYTKRVKECHEHVLKEIADVNYVSTGIGVVMNYDVHDAERKVHASNMTKTGSVTNGKLTKGDGYIMPDLSGDVYI